MSDRAPNRAFQAVLDGVPGAWFFARHDGSLAYTNRGACQSLGYAPEELARLTLFEIDPTLTREHWNALWAGRRPSESLVVRTRHRRSDGSEFPVEVRASRVVIEGEDLAASYTVDLTVSERAQVLNRRLLTAIAQASESVIVTDSTGNVEYVNPAYEQATGMQSTEVCGRAWSALEVAGDSSFLEQFFRVLSSGERWHGRTQSRRTSGERYDEDVSISPIRDDDGVLVGSVIVKRDITEQLRLEQQLRHTQKVEAVGQLAGGIAHDFNNLLQVIHGQAHLIQMRSQDDRLTPMLDEIGKAVDRASSLVRQLLAFSRKGTVEVSDVRLDELITSLSGLLRRLLGEHVSLEWIPTPGPVFVRGNVAQLEQVVANLCINARDAMPQGGRIALELSYPRAEDLPSAAPHLTPANTVLLSVSDDGVGMTDEVRERLFDPFFTTKEPGRGTGLGLATVYATVQAHRGYIDVTSRPALGACFRVFLPTIAAAAVEPAPPARPLRVSGRGRWALVAEDEPAVRDLTANYLRTAGFRVLTANDGVEAERLLLEAPGKIAVLVLDAVMPRRGGKDVHQAERERSGAIPTVFVTGYDYESLALAVQHENVAILQKPFTADELLSHVASVLHEAEQ